MENRDIQEDEVETLQAIYGEDIQILSREPSICYTVSVSTLDDELCIEITYPEGYPSKCPPVYELRGTEWLTSENIENIVRELTQIHKDSEGEVVVYQWIEYIREYLTTIYAEKKEDRGTLSPDSHTHEDLSHPTNQPSNTSQNVAESLGQLTVATATSKSEAERERQRVGGPVIVHGEPLTDRKSTFQAHAAVITNKEEVAVVVTELKSNKKIASATHNIMAFRCMDVGKGGVMVQDCDDDGESAAGGRLLHLLQMMGAVDVVVVVSRWYGGVLLHGDRFKHINNVARTLLQDSGIGMQQKREEERINTGKKGKRTKH